MPLKTYRGSAVAAVLARVEAELGPDALIVSVKQLRAASGGPLVEVVAGDAADAAVSAAVRETPRRQPVAVAAPVPVAPIAHHPALPETTSVLAFVGPTGVGKTTTVAKLAAHGKIFEGRRVGLVCLDTFKVGALEQLRAYAGLSKRQVEVAHDAAELDRAFARLAKCEVILLDCPGRSPANRRDSGAVAELVTRARPIEVHLALAPGQRPELARRVIDAHRPFGVTHLLATKIDECPDDWTLFELAMEMGLPMRWMTDGQRVPHDLRSAAARLDSLRATRRPQATHRFEGIA